MENNNSLARFILAFSLFLFISWIQSIQSPLAFLHESIYLSQPYDQKGAIKGGLYLLSYLFGVFTLLRVMSIRWVWLAWLLIPLIASLFAVDVFIQKIGSNSNGLSAEILSIMLNEAGRAENLWVYKTAFLYAALTFASILLWVAIIRHLTPARRYKRTYQSLFLLMLAILIAGGLVYKIPSITSQSYPAPIKTPLIITEYLANHRQVPTRLLDKSIKPTRPTEYKTMVWIIDESISGDYLAINGYHKDTTPYLSSIRESPDLKNYGVVTPISNCSNTSNLFLRIGLTSAIQQDFKQAKDSLPTIFQYAKQANFETYLIDAQISPGQLQNHLTSNDLKDIDHNITFSRSFFPNQRDKKLADKLKTILGTHDGKNRFVIAVKWGAHWPYPLAYPKHKTVFTPATSESLTEMNEGNREILTNAYLNAIRHTVDDFFRDLLETPLQAGQLIFYTADHGQSLFEKADSPLTHCHYNTDPTQLPRGEFKVPLLVFTPNAKTSFPSLENRLYTQEQIFPTTLALFGYSQAIQTAYGPTLLEGSKLGYTESFVLDSGLKITLPKP